jgi:hypothetical protein
MSRIFLEPQCQPVNLQGVTKRENVENFFFYCYDAEFLPVLY